MTGPRLSQTAANAAADAVCALLNGGLLKVYDGTMPETADTPITTQELLADIPWNAVAFRPAVNGKAIANVLEKGAGVSSGTARWFRAVQANGVPVFDGTVGKADANLILTSGWISDGAEILITDFTYAQALTGGDV